MLIYKDKCHWELLLFISPFPLSYIGAAIVFPWHVSALLIIEPTESETKVNICNFSLTHRHGLCNFLAVLLGVAWLNLLSFHVDFLPVPTYWTLHVFLRIGKCCSYIYITMMVLLFRISFVPRPPPPSISV
jgi:hypothetical protein